MLISTEMRSLQQRPRASATTGSVRTCIGCGALAPPAEMIRLRLDDAGTPTLRGRGRGAHVHPRARCLSGAAKRGLARSFRRDVRASEGALARVLVDAARTTASESIARAARAGQVSVGVAAVGAALDAGAAVSCVVAVDGSKEMNHPAIARAIGSGRAVALGNRRDLGALVRCADADVVGVHHPRLALRIAAACATIDALRVMQVPEVG